MRKPDRAEIFNWLLLLTGVSLIYVYGVGCGSGGDMVPPIGEVPPGAIIPEKCPSNCCVDGKIDPNKLSDPICNGSGVTDQSDQTLNFILCQTGMIVASTGDAINAAEAMVGIGNGAQAGGGGGGGGSGDGALGGTQGTLASSNSSHGTNGPQSNSPLNGTLNFSHANGVIIQRATGGGTISGQNDGGSLNPLQDGLGPNPRRGISSSAGGAGGSGNGIGSLGGETSLLKPSGAGDSEKNSSKGSAATAGSASTGSYNTGGGGFSMERAGVGSQESITRTGSTQDFTGKSNSAQEKEEKNTGGASSKIQGPEIGQDSSANLFKIVELQYGRIQKSWDKLLGAKKGVDTRTLQLLTTDPEKAIPVKAPKP